MSKVTYFNDMYTQAYYKTEYRKIVIMLPREQAIEKFKEIFSIDPEKTTCDCCYYIDYSIDEEDSLEEVISEWIYSGDEVFVCDPSKDIAYYSEDDYKYILCKKSI
jgi:hypothetical protein